MSMSALCKVCLYYNPSDKTCGRSLVAVNKGKVYHDLAKIVRVDGRRCGPHGKWFKEKEAMGPDGLSKKTAIDELFESFGI
jgi:hypothetical protein